MTDATAGEKDNIWDRLRRRKVVQWGIAYAAGAWGFLQGLEYVSSLLEWPAQLQKLTGLALLVGLPIVLVLAWYHGDRGEQRVSGTELTIITLLFVLGGGIFWWYQRGVEAPGPVSPQVVALPPSVATDPRPSIAVLPFDNRSRLEDDAHFVDGIHDDILTQLAKVSALKVISRASVERFRDTKLPMKDIAEQLGVSRILEGGVQRAGDRVRITVQLIDATTDAHLWAESYDRELTVANIFAIQSEVANAIATAMAATVTSAERTRVNAIPTQNLEAWEAYQLGRHRMAERTGAALADAERYFQEAVDRDPAFALAYAGLADAIWLGADKRGQPSEPAIARAEAVLAEALRLDPNLPEAVTTQASFAQDRREYVLAEAGFRRAIELNPNYATAHHWYSFFLGRLGREAESLQSMQKAVELDPMSVLLQGILGVYMAEMGRLREASARLSKARAIDPLSPLPYRMMADIRARNLGQLGDAIPFLWKAQELDAGGPRDPIKLAGIYLDLGDEAQSGYWLDQAMGDGAESSVRAYRHLYAGDTSKALTSARKALEFDPRDWEALALLRNADLGANDLKAAYSRYARVFPELLERQAPIDRFNFIPAIDLALVLLQMGRREQAADLLDRSESFVNRIFRIGSAGYGIQDARIHALRGDRASALAALREAENSGWRDAWRYARDFDPAFDSIRNEPEFKAVFADIERDMARQRAALAARPKDAPLDLAIRN